MLTESQLIDRKRGIGGSDAAAVCGMSKWMTPLDVYIDKTSEEIKEIDNKYVYWGNMLEPIVAQQYSIETGKSLSGSVSAQSKEYPFMLANVDSTISDGGILECKTADARMSKQWGEIGTDSFPDEYLLQCAHYAIVFDAPYVDLAVLIGGNDFRIYTYQRNKNLEKSIIDKEKEFWEENVLKMIPPPPQNVDDLTKIAKTNGNMKIVNDSIKKLLHELQNIESTIKNFEEKKDTISFSVKEIIGDHDGLIDEYGIHLATWKIQQANRFDTTLFKKAHPDIYKKFSKQSTSRVFRLRRNSGE